MKAHKREKKFGEVILNIPTNFQKQKLLFSHISLALFLEKTMNKLFCFAFISTCLLACCEGAALVTTFLYENSDVNCQGQIVQFIYGLDLSSTCTSLNMPENSPNCSKDPNDNRMKRIVCNTGGTLPPTNYPSGNYAIQILSQNSCTNPPISFIGVLLDKCSSFGGGFVKSICSPGGLIRTFYNDGNCLQAAAPSDNFILGCTTDSGLSALTTCPSANDSSSFLVNKTTLITILLCLSVIFAL